MNSVKVGYYFTSWNTINLWRRHCTMWLEGSKWP